MAPRGGRRGNQPGNGITRHTNPSGRPRRSTTLGKLDTSPSSPHHGSSSSGFEDFEVERTHSATKNTSRTKISGKRPDQDPEKAMDSISLDSRNPSPSRRSLRSESGGYTWSETGSQTRRSTPVRAGEVPDSIWELGSDDEDGNDDDTAIPQFSSPGPEMSKLPDTAPLPAASIPMTQPQIDFSETASTIHRSSPFDPDGIPHEGWDFFAKSSTGRQSTVPASDGQLDDTMPLHSTHFPLDELSNATHEDAAADEPTSQFHKASSSHQVRQDAGAALRAPGSDEKSRKRKQRAKTPLEFNEATQEITDASRSKRHAGPQQVLQDSPEPVKSAPKPRRKQPPRKAAQKKNKRGQATTKKGAKPPSKPSGGEMMKALDLEQAPIEKDTEKPAQVATVPELTATAVSVSQVPASPHGHDQRAQSPGDGGKSEPKPAEAITVSSDTEDWLDTVSLGSRVLVGMSRGQESHAPPVCESAVTTNPHPDVFNCVSLSTKNRQPVVDRENPGDQSGQIVKSALQAEIQGGMGQVSSGTELTEYAGQDKPPQNSGISGWREPLESMPPKTTVSRTHLPPSPSHPVSGIDTTFPFKPKAAQEESRHAKQPLPVSRFRRVSIGENGSPLHVEPRDGSAPRAGTESQPQGRLIGEGLSLRVQDKPRYSFKRRTISIRNVPAMPDSVIETPDMEASQKATVVPIAQEAAAKQDPAIDRFEELCRPSHPTPPEIDISGRNEHLRTRILEGLQRVDDTGVENNDLQNMHGTSSNDGRLFASKSEPKATLGRQLHHLIDKLVVHLHSKKAALLQVTTDYHQQTGSCVDRIQRRFVKERESLTRYSETNTSHFESHVQAARKMVKESRHDRRRLVADLEKVLTQKTESHSESRYRLQQIERHVVDKYGIEMRETV